MVPTALKLHYLQGRSRGELIRYILHYAQVPFVDQRYEWSQRAEINKKFPLGQVPALEYTDEKGQRHMMLQKNAIARTCAKWFGLAGQTAVEAANADEAHECLRDLFDYGSICNWEADPAKKAALIKQAQTVKVPKTLEYLQQKLKERGGVYLAGGKSFTYADLYVATVFDHITRDICVIPKVAERPAIVDLTSLKKDFPVIMAIKDRVENIPSIKKYLSTRPETPF